MNVMIILLCLVCYHWQTLSSYLLVLFTGGRCSANELSKKWDIYCIIKQICPITTRQWFVSFTAVPQSIYADLLTFQSRVVKFVVAIRIRRAGGSIPS